MKQAQDTFPGKCPEKPLRQGLLSHHGVKEKYQPLYQKLVLNMVRLTGLEPVPSRTRPSNVRVCLFRHNRVSTDTIIPARGGLVKYLIALN